VVTLGREEVTLPLPEPLDIEPGTITATGVMEGKRYEGTGEAVAGKVLKIEMKVPAAVVQAAEVAKPSSEELQSSSTRYIVSGSLVTVGLVGVGLGVGFTMGANKASDDVAKLSTGLADDACARTASGDCDALKKAGENRVRNSNVAVGSYIAGGALLTAGVAAYLFWPKASTQSAKVLPWIGTGVAGITYGKEF
jgi:hypothetical protein